MPRIESFQQNSHPESIDLHNARVLTPEEQAYARKITAEQDAKREEAKKNRSPFNNTMIIDPEMVAAATKEVKQQEASTLTKIRGWFSEKK